MNNLQSQKDVKKRTKLTEKEQLYFDIMKSGNVLFLKGAPGTAKSAITNTIADIMGFQHISLHLAQADNVDLGQYPIPKEKDGYTVIDFAVPGWAVKANQKPTIVHFEELNRCRQDIQDAALQLLNEKAIGTNFKFNENVYMVSSGNLGEEDGTEVKDLDAAMNNRLVHHRHVLTLDEWIQGYAKDNIHEVIVSFLRAYPEYYLRTPTENDPRYPTPRSWTNLDKFIKCNIKSQTSLAEIETQLLRAGTDFIGSAITKFIRYLEDIKDLNWIDVMDRWEQIKDEKINRIKVSEMLQQAREYDVEKMTKKQLSNVIAFADKIIDVSNEDQFVNYALYVLRGIKITEDKKLEDKPKSIKLAKWFRDKLDLTKLVRESAEDDDSEKIKA